MKLTMTDFTRLISLTAAVALAACGDDAESPVDAGVAMDAAAQITDRGMYVPPDAGQTQAPADSGTTSGPRDAGHYCAPNNEIAVGNDNVSVNAADEIVNSTAVLNCIDEQPPRDIPAAITMRVCVNLIGSSTTATKEEIDDLEVAIFYDQNLSTGMAVDPTFTASTGADLEPTSRVDTSTSYIASTSCKSGIEIELGRASLGNNAVKAAVDYTVRLRSLSGTGPWATVYHDKAKVYADRIIGGGANPANCDPTICTGVINAYAVRKAELAEIVNASGQSIDGAADLADGVGEGHALIVANDCQTSAMENAVAGFSPAAKVSGYLTEGVVSSSAKGTNTSGLFVGLGFGTSYDVSAAVGIMRHADTCTEEFAGGAIKVYPDAITVFASSPSNTLNQ